jgi:hypothetical protein
MPTLTVNSIYATPSLFAISLWDSGSGSKRKIPSISCTSPLNHKGGIRYLPQLDERQVDYRANHVVRRDRGGRDYLDAYQLADSIEVPA